MKCERCGNSTRKVLMQKDGALWCPVCHEDAAREGIQGSTAIFRDEIPGGVICENYGPHPIRFDSHSERRAYMRAHDLREKEKFSPLPGTDKDPAGIPNPDGYKDPYTLASGAELIKRNGKGADFDPSSVMTITSGTMSREDAIRIQDESRRG